MADLVGVILGQYRILKLLGWDKIADVYKTWQPSLRHHAAPVVPNPPFSCAAGFASSFQDEAKAAADQKHDGTVTFHDVGTEDCYHYVAMEFIAGSSLPAHIRSRGADPLNDTADIVTQVSSALDHSRQRGFIHNNVDSANVLIDRSRYA